MNESRDLTAEFAALGPWIFQFEIDGKPYGGGVSAVGDVRLERFWQFAPRARTILELGSLEGAHTFLLAAQPHVTRVLAVEARAANLRKARFVQELLEIRNVDFLRANLEDTDLGLFGKFDAVFCSGLLYHLPEPWKLIERLPAMAPVLFIWTQYAADEDAVDVGNGFQGKIHVEGGPEEPLSGMSQTATWLTLSSLRDLLAACGYKTIEVLHDDPAHANGPAVTIGARSI